MYYNAITKFVPGKRYKTKSVLPDRRMPRDMTVLKRESDNIEIEYNGNIYETRAAVGSDAVEKLTLSDSVATLIFYSNKELEEKHRHMIFTCECKSCGDTYWSTRKDVQCRSCGSKDIISETAQERKARIGK